MVNHERHETMQDVVHDIVSEEKAARAAIAYREHYPNPVRLVKDHTRPEASDHAHFDRVEEESHKNEGAVMEWITEYRAECTICGQVDTWTTAEDM